MSKTNLRFSVVAGVLAGFVALPALASHVHVPVALRRTGVHPHATPARSPSDVEWSAVLTDVPVPPGSELAFFEVRPVTSASIAVADYAVDGLDPAGLGRWYRGRMPALGWRLEAVSAASQTWRKGRGQLQIDLPASGAGSRWLRLARDAGGSLPAGGRSLVAGLPLPAKATRQRYDRADLLIEEARLPVPLAAAERAVEQALAGAGWSETGSSYLGGARVRRYEGPGGMVLASVRSIDAGESEIALGTADCLGLASPAPRAESVYLDGVPAPPDSSLAGFELDGNGRASERWRAACQDIDLMIAETGSDWSELGWSVSADVQRSSGLASLTGRPPAGPPVTLEARAIPAGVIGTRLGRASEGCRSTAGRSLLFPDLLLPDGASPQRLEVDNEGSWPWTETYLAPAGADAASSWLRPEMAALRWRFEREVGVGQERQLVFYGGGEEVLYALLGSGPSTVVLSRRRICPSDAVETVPDQGGSARTLAEMPVFPGARFLSWGAGAESYAASCTSLDQLEDWYRRALERGNWSLAMVVGPDDPSTRTLLFVRPDERSLPPALRSAWAEVELARPWPYSYQLAHRRDPGGMLPLGSARSAP